MRVQTENLSLIRDYIILGFMLEMTDLPKYKHLTDLIHADLLHVRKELRKRGIKVVEDEKSDFVFNYKYWFEGYEANFGITRDVAKTQIGIKMGKIVRDYEGK